MLFGFPPLPLLPSFLPAFLPSSFHHPPCLRRRGLLHVLSSTRKPQYQKRVEEAREKQYSPDFTHLYKNGRAKQISDCFLPTTAVQGHKEASLVVTLSKLFNMQPGSTPLTLISTNHFSTQATASHLTRNFPTVGLRLQCEIGKNRPSLNLKIATRTFPAMAYYSLTKLIVRQPLSETTLSSET